MTRSGLGSRLRLGLVVAALLLCAGTAVRTLRIASAVPTAGAVMMPLEVSSLAGGLLVEPGDQGWSARLLSRGGDVELQPGSEQSLGPLLLRLEEERPQLSREILRQPWSVFAAERGGHMRIDFGADPLGRVDGTRDRVRLPAGAAGELGWFHLVPLLEPGEAERGFLPEDWGRARLVPERAGLVVRSRDGVVRPELGQALDLSGSFEVETEDGRVGALRIAWTEGLRSDPVVDASGQVLGYSARGGSDLVVEVVRDDPDSTDRTVLTVLRSGSEPVARVELGDKPVLLYGRRDRLGPLRGGVLPDEAPNVELQQAVDRGLHGGWIAVEPGRSRVVRSSPGKPSPELGALDRSLARSVVSLLDRYDRARLPVALRLGPELQASAATAQAAGEEASLRYDSLLDAWRPSSQPRGGADVTFRLPVVGDSGRAALASAFPASWRPEGAEHWQRLPPAPGQSWSWHSVPAEQGEVIEVRLATELPGGVESSSVSGRLRASIAGGPEGSFLDPDGARVGPRAFEGWTLRSVRSTAAAEALWSKIPGDRWAVDGTVEEPASLRSRSLYVRLPVDAARAGGLALDIELPGRALSAWWNDQPWESSALPSDAHGGIARLSLPLAPGGNLLVLHIELPPLAPAQEAGGVRFEVDAAGRPQRLASQVASLQARSALRERPGASGPGLAVEAAAWVQVERAVEGLPVGTRWQVVPGADGSGRSSLVLVSEPVELAVTSLGGLAWGEEGLAWSPGRAVSGRPVLRMEEDPAGPPRLGPALSPGRAHVLGQSGDGVVGAGYGLRVAPGSGGLLAGDLVVVGAGRATVLDRWGSLAESWPGPEEATALQVDLEARADGKLLVSVSRPARLWSRSGRETRLRPGERWSWPAGARLAVDGTALRLVRPERVAPEDMEPGLRWLLARHEVDEPTIDPTLQRLARQVLEDELERLPPSFGEVAAEDLRGALLLMDSRSGDILACAAVDGGASDAASGSMEACWSDRGLHPGSVFKVATAAAALGSSDPTVLGMLQGRLPPGLSKAGPRRTLFGAVLPTTDGRGRLLRSRLKNFRGQWMPVDADLEDALRSSLNTWFGYLGLLMHRPFREGWSGVAVAARPDREAAWPVRTVAREVGFDRHFALGAGLRGTGGSVPSLAADSDAAVAARSIGQDAVTATPIGVASLLAMAAEDGLAPRPRISRDRPVERARVISPAAAESLGSGLSTVVSRGTASRAFADNPRRARILGKTGSSQRVDRWGVLRTDAWFAGVVQPPRGSSESSIVAVCVLPGGGLGGRHAAEVVDSISRSLARSRGWDRPASP